MSQAQDEYRLAKKVDRLAMQLKDTLEKLPMCPKVADQGNVEDWLLGLVKVANAIASQCKVEAVMDVLHQARDVGNPETIANAILHELNKF